MERMETMSPNKRRHHTTPGSNCVNHQNLNSNNAKSIGIVQLSFAYLFEQIKRRKLRDKTLYVITVSYLEVYNEQVNGMFLLLHRNGFEIDTENVLT